ncbi:hypothetical protein BGHDH14_bghG000349000002001 [Blumeria hordei DH14]|uniref:Uncharacterized protein n=1 Tax=Blumeria graminis f. sp. hordei (strain DH14) TaxID=546991 RepID=N1J4T8_BLUG1|nr:hypothetical protein BGHDH14_bghG000349000002001 [Blumeria hordei DH14]
MVYLVLEVIYYREDILVSYAFNVFARCPDNGNRQLLHKNFSLSCLTNHDIDYAGVFNYDNQFLNHHEVNLQFRRAELYSQCESKYILS